MQNQHGKLFSNVLSQEIKEKFMFVDYDYSGKKRLFFENAGGSLKLKKAWEKFAEIESIGDCPERIHQTASYLNEIIDAGTRDIKIILNAHNSGSIITMLTASQVIFEMTRVITENISGKNIVTTKLEHPSAYDASEFYAQKMSMELRVANTNKITGGVDADEIVALIDKDTCLLSVIYASNISGAILDIADIVKKARAVNPDLYVIVDAVQHAPHGLIDTDSLGIDAINFAPYKFFGIRGLGVGYLSDRAAKLPHHKLAGKESAEWELGSPAPAHFAAITAVVDYVCWVGGFPDGSNTRRELFKQGMEKIKLHERALLHHLLNGSGQIKGLRHIPGVTVHLDDPNLGNRDLIAAFEISNLGYVDTVKEYETESVTVFERIASSIYSKRIIESFGLAGAIRISPLHCHTIEDINEFLKITARIANKHIQLR